MQKTALTGDRALVSISRDLIARRPGDRLPTVGDYQDRLGLGSGTVQDRLRTLSHLGAIETRARGRQGTYLMSSDLAQLWSAAALGAVRGLMPLPEAAEPVALAVALRRQFEALGIPLELLYLHGSECRIDLVRSGRAHFAVTSRPAAVAAASADPQSWCRFDLAPGSYHRDDSNVVHLRPHLGRDDRIIKIGIDPDCHDHIALTSAEFPEAEGYVSVECPHSRLPMEVAAGFIDAAIWLRTSPAVPLATIGVGTRPLHRAAAISLNRELGRAVVLCDARYPHVAAVLERADLSTVLPIQQEILRSETLPLY